MVSGKNLYDLPHSGEDAMQTKSSSVKQSILDVSYGNLDPIKNRHIYFFPIHPKSLKA